MTLRSALIVTLSIFIGGCSDESAGPQKYEVEGFLLLDEKPVVQASLRFIPDASSGNAGPAAFANVKNGAFQIPADQGLVAGASKVEITIAASDSSGPGGTTSQTVTIKDSGINVLALDVKSDDLQAAGIGEDGEGEDGEDGEEEDD